MAYPGLAKSYYYPSISYRAARIVKLDKIGQIKTTDFSARPAAGTKEIESRRAGTPVQSFRPLSAGKTRYGKKMEGKKIATCLRMPVDHFSALRFFCHICIELN